MQKRSFFRTLLLISLGLSNPNSISVADLPKENTFLVERVRKDYALFKKERQESILTSVLRYDYTNMDSLLNSVEDRIRRLGGGESDNTYYAVSPCGAVGLLQVTPITATEYGIDPDRIYKFEEYSAGCDTTYGIMLTAARDSLVNNPLLDDREKMAALIRLDVRFNPWKNTIIGSSHLDGLLKYYNGNEDLAVAAYNFGSTNLNEVVAEFGDGWKAEIPEETRNLLARFHGKDSID